MSTINRRRFIAATGGVTVAFSLSRGAVARDGDTGAAEALPGSLAGTPTLDAWIRIDPTGAITVATGKAELGQGIATALLMLAAEELVVDPAEITMITADTAQTPDEGYTAASHSMEMSGTAIRYAAANVRALLVEEAARQLGTDAASLTVAKGEVRGPGGALSYGALAAALDLSVPARSDVSLLPRAAHRVTGTDVPRIDIPAKVTGAPIFVQDFRPEGMVHARVVRPPGPGARLVSADLEDIDAMPGVIGTHRDGSFLAVVARGEWQAVQAAQALERIAVWDTPATLPPQDAISDWLRANETDVGTVAEAGAGDVPEGPGTLRATYDRPYTLHGSIGPSAAVDSGHAVSPDGIRNQTEGGIVQSLSWTLFEAVTFDDRRVTSTDWTSYPMARFADVPERVTVHVMERPGAPFLGTGEAAQGPTAAAIGNALRDATGTRLRSLPLSPDRVKAALEREA